MGKISRADKFAQFSDTWSPKLVGQVNDMDVRLVKLQGEFVWHQHEHEDEMFFIIAGRLLLKFRDQDMWLKTGEFVIVPRGVEHLPVAEKEVRVMLFERTVAELQRL